MLEGEPMARKRTKKEAKQRIDDLPRFEILGGPKGRIIGKGARSLGKLLVDLDPLDRLAAETEVMPTPPVAQLPPAPSVSPPTPTSGQAIQRVINDPTVKMTPETMRVINDDSIIMLDDGSLAQVMVPSERSRQFERQNILPQTTKRKRKRSKYNIELSKQLKQLRINGYLNSRREGTQIYYKLVDQKFLKIMKAFKDTF